MKIEISKLPPEGANLLSDVPPEIIDIEGEAVVFDAPIKADLFAQVAGETLIVKGRISARPRLQCSRCLEYFEYSIERPSYIFSTTVGEGDIIDLTESIREDIIIALPLKPLCAEECKGLCPGCGMNRNEGKCDCGDP